MMNRAFELVQKRADALFQAASFVGHIHNKNDYHQALELMDELVEDYERNRLLIEVLSVAIERWEDSAREFSDFNRNISGSTDGEALFHTLMEQYNLGVADFPEIGSKSLISKILHGERRLTRDHIELLSRRFHISPALFF